MENELLKNLGISTGHSDLMQWGIIIIGTFLLFYIFDFIGKKIVEEAGEVWISAEYEGKERTAEEIKITIGTVFPGNKNEKMEVRGRDLVTGLPHTITLTSEEVEEALRESLYTIIHAAKGILEQTPPELSADIVNKGIFAYRFGK